MKKQKIKMRICILLSLTVLHTNITQVQAQEQGSSDQEMWFDEDPNNIEETLIDFTKFEENIKASGLYAESDEIRKKKLSELTAEDVDPETLQPAYTIESSDMYYDKWIVQLNSSANEVENARYSYTKKVQLRKAYEGGETEAKRPAQGTGETVLGARIHFPMHDHNAYALIRPPFEIKTYNEKGQVISRKKTGKNIGVIDNVGTIKRIALDVSGRNYMKGIGIRLKDQFDNVTEYFMGYTYFANWRRLNWINHAYIEQVAHRHLFRVPLYPREIPHKKFDSLIVYRPGKEVGGDFVVYFRKIDLWFDYAVPTQIYKDLDINDEAQWQILTEKARKLQKAERKQHREHISLLRQAQATKISSPAENTAEQPTQTQ